MKLPKFEVVDSPARTTKKGVLARKFFTALVPQIHAIKPGKSLFIPLPDLQKYGGVSISTKNCSYLKRYLKDSLTEDQMGMIAFSMATDNNKKPIGLYISRHKVAE